MTGDVKNSMELLSDVRKRISEQDFEECRQCTKIAMEGGKEYCTDKKCRALKKRQFTRARKIWKKSFWRKIESKLPYIGLYDRSIFPYLLLEQIARNIYDDEIISVLENYGLLKNDLKKLYTFESQRVKGIIEVIVLRMCGVYRAEQIISNFESKEECLK